MKKRLARSFVVTLAMLPACNRHDTAQQTSNPPPVETTPTTTAVSPLGINANPPPVPPTKKRRRTSTPTEPTQSAGDVPYPQLVSQQPNDAKGRAIYVAYDDRCYVEEPMKPPYAPLPTGARAVESIYVDCPAALDDPAWDSCTSSWLAFAPGKSACFCVSLGGNPPPPPTKNACPDPTNRPKK